MACLLAFARFRSTRIHHKHNVFAASDWLIAVTIVCPASEGKPFFGDSTELRCGAQIQFSTDIHSGAHIECWCKHPRTRNNWHPSQMWCGSGDGQMASHKMKLCAKPVHFDQKVWSRYRSSAEPVWRNSAHSGSIVPFENDRRPTSGGSCTHDVWCARTHTLTNGSWMTTVKSTVEATNNIQDRALRGKMCCAHTHIDKSKQSRPEH